MNRPLLCSALLAAFVACVHIFLGGPTIATPLLNSGLEPETKLTLYACWHIVSVTLTLSAIALMRAALPRHTTKMHDAVILVSLLWCGFGVVFFVIAAIQGDVEWFLRLPQWMLITPVGALGLWGARRSTRA